MATACSNIIRRDRVRRSLARPSTELEVSAPAAASKFTIRLLSRRAASAAGHLDHLDPSIRPKFRSLQLYKNALSRVLYLCNKDLYYLSSFSHPNAANSVSSEIRPRSHKSILERDADQRFYVYVRAKSSCDVGLNVMFAYLYENFQSSAEPHPYEVRNSWLQPKVFESQKNVHAPSAHCKRYFMCGTRLI